MPVTANDWRAVPACTWVTVAVMLVAIGCSVRILVQEAVVARTEHRLEAQSLAADAGLKFTVPARTPSLDAPPRALLADALMRARVAQALPAQPIRRQLLDDAMTELATIRARRPFWGEAWSTSAFVSVLRNGPDTPEGRAALQRSYADAPYLRRAAEWRIAYGIDQWHALDPETRRRMLNEAVWLSRSSSTSLDTVMKLVRGTPAYAAFMVRWIANRRADSDFQLR